MSNKWLLILHQVPPTPPYLRARILRRLKEVGALPLKKSAYLLPAGDEALEDCQWLLREIQDGGGEAWIFETEARGGLTDDAIRAGFNELRAADYSELFAEARAAAANPDASWRRLKRRLEEVSRIDFFGAPGKEEAMALIREIEQRAGAAKPETESPADALKGRTWVTRRGIKIDRTASAWLVLRFIDPLARFSFVDPAHYSHGPGEIRFDMFEGEFTHQGDKCTFEVLFERTGVHDAGLQAIAEIVHDLDMKETKFERPETAGVRLMIEGLALRHEADEQRLAEGLVIFDALYARLRAS